MIDTCLNKDIRFLRQSGQCLNLGDLEANFVSTEGSCLGREELEWLSSNREGLIRSLIKQNSPRCQKPTEPGVECRWVLWLVKRWIFEFYWLQTWRSYDGAG